MKNIKNKLATILCFVLAAALVLPTVRVNAAEYVYSVEEYEAIKDELDDDDVVEFVQGTTTLTCGKEEHEQHTDDCFELTCGTEEHEHTDDCLVLNCDKEAHTHDESCKVLTCETAEHTHTEGCIGYVCTETEHQHDDGCYKTEIEYHGKHFPSILAVIAYYLTFGRWDFRVEDTREVTVLDCDIEEHTHTDNCKDYVCGSEEHEHGDDCYDLCDKEEHQHDESEYDYKDAEHTHDDSCYALTCQKELHTHTEDCYNTTPGYYVVTVNEKEAREVEFNFFTQIRGYDHSDDTTNGSKLESISSSLYIPWGKVVGTIKEVDLINFNELNPDGEYPDSEEKLKAEVERRLAEWYGVTTPDINNAEILKNYVDGDVDFENYVYSVDWYVIKLEADGWHVDGIITVTPVPGDNGNETGDNGNETGDNGNETGDNGNETGDNGNETGDNGNETGDNGNETGDNGNETGDNGNETGDNGNETGDNGNETGDNGNETGDNGNETGDNGNETGDNGNETGNNGENDGRDGNGDVSNNDNDNDDNNGTPADNGTNPVIDREPVNIVPRDDAQDDIDIEDVTTPEGTPADEEVVDVDETETPEGAPAADEDEVDLDDVITPEGAPADDAAEADAADDAEEAVENDAEDIALDALDTPQGDALPQTGVASAVVFYGIGAACIAFGGTTLAKIRRRENED